MKTVPELEFDLNLRTQLKDFKPKELWIVGYSFDEKNKLFAFLLPKLILK